MKKVFTPIFLLAIALFSFTSLDASMLNQEESFNNIVIFIKFADETDYDAPFPLAHYEDLFNAEDKVSLRDYYLEVTYNQLTIDSFLVSEDSEIVWYQDINDRSYYEPYDRNTNPDGVREDGQADREHALLKRAVDYVDDNNLVPDDMVLDANDDGTIDSITFMISGEDNGWNSLFWPHMWNIYTYQDDYGDFTAQAPSINGIYALDYTFELLGNSTGYTEQVQVGVLAHETFHLLSAPDLYHYYEYQYVTPVGDWGIMDGTTDTPSHMLGYMKYKYGNWITEIDTITESGTYTLEPLQDSGDNIYRIPTGYPNEYIILEYRDTSGLYESHLPDSGLLVYRVNTSLNGNEDGSYNDQGISQDEIWVFRPGMDDQTPPIIIGDTDYAVDGYINSAALSDENSYSSAGATTDILLFNGDGELINISIGNIDEENGSVTFDVTLPMNIILNTKIDLPSDEVILFDNSAMDYTVDINNLPSNSDVYYTLDGSTPTEDDTPLTNSTLSIDGDNNIVTVAVYKDGAFVSSIQKEFNFSSTIESDHNPYGNELDLYWYLDFGTPTQFEINANSNSFLEVDYDYLYLTDINGTKDFTGNTLGDISETYTGEYLLINMFTDQLVDDGFGFELDVTIKSSVDFQMAGEPNISIPVGTTYTDLGATISGEDASLYTIETINNVDTSTPGTYTVTYNLLDNNNAVTTSLVRTVEVTDSIAPEVTLNGSNSVSIELGNSFNDLGVTATDNVDNDLTIIVTDNIVSSRPGTYTVTYTVTDDSNNKTIVTRTVIIEDTTAPEGLLTSGIDTLIEGSSWIDFGITTSDLTKTTTTVTGEVDTSKAGTYEIEYTIKDTSNNEVKISRFVTILSANDKTITCDPFVSTTIQNVKVDLGSCHVNGEEMIMDDSNVNYTKSGQYKIEYSYNDNGHTYNKYQYIYVLGVSSKSVAYIEEERKDYL